MGKKYNIKWRPIDNKKLSQAVRSYNSKLTRTVNKYPELKDYMPPRVNVKDLKKEITNRADYNRIIKSLKRFLKKGAEKPIITKGGVKTTRYQKRELQLNIQRINRERAKQRARIQNAKEHGTYDIMYNETLIPKRSDIENIKVKDWDKFVESIEKQAKGDYYSEKNRQLKENWLSAFDTIFGQMGGSVRTAVELMPSDVFVDSFFYDDIMSIDFVYDPLEAEVKLDAIQEILQTFISQNSASMLSRMGQKAFDLLLNAIHM